jgi:beta-1,4-N-acetylglucosaminyltransferase
VLSVSAAKAHAFEAAHGRGGGYEVHVIRRSREVGQSFVSSVWTTTLALLDAAALVHASRPQLLLCNGPGTCLPLVAAAVALRAVGPSRACGCVYVESVARVQHLSLTGRLLYSLRLADAFFVQWEALVRAHPRAVCLGRLM